MDAGEAHRLRALLDQLHTQVADLDAAGCYRFVNRAYAERLGLDRASLPGRGVREVEGAEWCAAVERCRTAAEAGEEAAECRVRLPRGDGALRAFELCCRALPAEVGGGVLALIEDVTEAQRAEEERNLFEERLAQAQRMEALGTLAGGIAHDFNNILGVVMGYAELSLLKLGDGNPVQPFLEQVISAAERAKNVVRQILAFSRNTEHQRQPVALVPLVKEVLKLLRATLPSTIELVEDLDPATSQVVADPSQLHQVVLNLCTNAYQAMREHGGRLEVQLRDVSLPEGTWVELVVRDDGCGMPPQVRKRVFEPYYTTRPVGEGTGMGLAVVHGIVTGLGGQVSVDSAPAQGSTFRVRLPARSDVAEAAPGPRRVAPGAGQRVLFVDDEPALAELGRALLETLGYQVTATTSSVEALELFRADPDGFDCVVTDQTLPQMTGGELTARLLQLRPELPVVLCTGYSELIDAEGARTLGAREFLLKPLDVRRLGNAVAAALGGADRG